MNKNGIYNRCKMWQLCFFAMSDASTNCWLFFMNFIMYYATGFLGLAVMTVSTIVMSMRIFDGITDPIIGWVVDKTNGRFGKFRPFMIGGNLIMIISAGLMVHVSHLMPKSIQTLMFILFYVLYIIGYTLHCTATKAAQSCLTNAPEQRPMFSLFNGIYVMLIFSGLPLMITNYLVPKYQGFRLGFFHEFWAIQSCLSFILMVLAVIGIWSKDRKEYFGLSDQPKVRFRDYWDTMKNNRGIQMLTLAASSDKLANTIATNATVLIMLFGIIIGNYSTYGEISAFTAIPSFIILFAGIQIARKFGQKTALVGATWLSILFHSILFCIIVFGDPTKISLRNGGIMTVLFVVFYVLMGATKNVATNMVIPMIPDVADYETYRSGRYVPGMMSTLFSFVDKMVSSFNTAVVGLFVSFIGFKTALPTQDTPYSNAILIVTLILYFGFPVAGWICTLIAMKFYPLTDEKMREIQQKIAELKQREREKPV